VLLHAGTRRSTATLPAGSAATGSRAQPRQRARLRNPPASRRKKRRSSRTNNDKTEKQPAAAAAAAAANAAVRAASAASPPCDVSPFTNAGCLTVTASTVARAPSRQATLVLFTRVVSAPAIMHGE
jgi:hypothetical protein